MQRKKFAVAAAALVIAFAVPLWKLLQFSQQSDFHSYIPLMPLIGGYLVWTKKSELPRASWPARGLAALLGLAGIATAAGYVAIIHAGAATENKLAVATLAWLLCLAGAGCWFLGGATMRAVAFPFSLMIFMVPFPTALREGIEFFLQHGSAIVAQWLFVLAGTPLLRDGLVFQLPGGPIHVGPECSGIQSTLCLCITSLVAGNLILNRCRNRVVLFLAVLPLALLRNGFRVFVIGQWQLVDSWVHHRGGPLFFVLSLVPFFLLLYFLRTSESRAAGAPPKPGDK